MLTLQCLVRLKGHTYLKKLAAFTYKFFYVCVTFKWTPGTKGLTKIRIFHIQMQRLRSILEYCYSKKLHKTPQKTSMRKSFSYFVAGVRTTILPKNESATGAFLRIM